MKRRNIIIAILSITLTIIVLIGSSYAYLRQERKGSDQNITIANFGLVITKDMDAITLNNEVPKKDEDGLKNSPSTFSIKNEGDIEANFKLSLIDDELLKSSMSNNNIRYKLKRTRSTTGESEEFEIRTLKSDGVIDEGTIDSKEEISYEIIIWIDYDANPNGLSFRKVLSLEGSQIDVKNTLYTKITDAIKEHPETSIVEDDVTYLSGSNDVVNYNYVWYSGKLWRITSINKDGTIKMVTENCITVIQWGLDINFADSWVKEWLNEDFKETLANDENIIADYDWNATSVSDYISKPNNTTIVKGKVGLLNSHDYYKSYENINDSSQSYLNIKFSWFLLNPKDDIEKIYIYLGNFRTFDKSQIGIGANGVRPAIVLQPNLTTYEGDGSKEHPYVIGDTTNSINYNFTKLNTRVSGEYVKFYNDIYRIVNIEDTKATKLVAVNYFSKANQIVLKSISSSVYYGNGNNDSYWDYYLNNVWYKGIPENYQKMLVKSKYYLGQYQVNQSYKNTICKSNNPKETIKNCEKTSTFWEGYVGLLRVGEMFESIANEASISEGVWIITPYNATGVRYLNGNDNGHLSDREYNTSTRAVKPTISISKDAVIVSGDGMTPETAYTIALP